MTMKGKLSAAEAIGECAAELAKQSWCIDVTGHRRMALHARSDRTACLDALSVEFKKWIASTGNTVSGLDPDDWKNLADRIADKLPQIYGSTFRPVDQTFLNVHGLQLVNTYVPFRPGATGRSGRASTC